MYNCAAAEAAAVGEAMTFFLIPTKNLAPPTAPDLVFRFYLLTLVRTTFAYTQARWYGRVPTPSRRVGRC